MRNTAVFILTYCAVLPTVAQTVENVEYSPRPYYLIDYMKEGALKDRYSQCMVQEG